MKKHQYLIDKFEEEFGEMKGVTIKEIRNRLTDKLDFNEFEETLENIQDAIGNKS